MPKPHLVLSPPMLCVLNSFWTREGFAEVILVFRRVAPETQVGMATRHMFP